MSFWENWGFKKSKKIGALEFNTYFDNQKKVRRVHSARSFSFQSPVPLNFNEALQTTGRNLVDTWGQSLQVFVRNASEAALAAWVFSDFPKVREQFYTIGFSISNPEARIDSLIKFCSSKSIQLKVLQISTQELFSENTLLDIQLDWGAAFLETQLNLLGLSRSEGPTANLGPPVWPFYKGGELEELRLPTFEYSSIFRYMDEKHAGEPSLLTSNEMLLSAWIHSDYFRFLLNLGKRGFNTNYRDHSLGAALRYLGIVKERPDSQTLSSSFWEQAEKGRITEEQRRSVGQILAPESKSSRRSHSGSLKALLSELEKSAEDEDISEQHLYDTIYPSIREYAVHGLPAKERLPSPSDSSGFHEISTFSTPVGIYQFSESTEHLLKPLPKLPWQLKNHAYISPISSNSDLNCPKLRSFFEKSISTYLQEITYIYDSFEFTEFVMMRIIPGESLSIDPRGTSFITGLFSLDEAAGATLIKRPFTPTFFTPKIVEVNHHNAHAIDFGAEVGRLILFPSSLPYAVMNHDNSRERTLLMFELTLRGELGTPKLANYVKL